MHVSTSVSYNQALKDKGMMNSKKDKIKIQGTIENKSYRLWERTMC
jgi:hypothetical protein